MSDRQLNSLWYHHLRVDPGVLISQGFMWEWEYVATLGNGATDTVAFTVGPFATGLFASKFSTTGTRGALVDFFASGSLGAGTPIQGFPLNHHVQKPSPLTNIESGGIVLFPGTQIGTRILGETIEAGDFVEPVIVAPNAFYYIEITNLHNQSADITITLAMSALLGLIE